jgi:hypothetical protein
MGERMAGVSTGHAKNDDDELLADAFQAAVAKARELGFAKIPTLVRV